MVSFRLSLYIEDRIHMQNYFNFLNQVGLIDIQPKLRSQTVCDIVPLTMELTENVKGQA